MANSWLTEQIHAYPARVENELRVNLLNEVRLASRSTDMLFNHTISVRNKNHWRTYEIFLKAALEYNREMSWFELSNECVLLYRLAELYRRRPGYQNAAKRLIRQFNRQVKAITSTGTRAWLLSKVLYEEAYMAYMANCKTKAAHDLLENAKKMARHQGMEVGALISETIMAVAEMRKGADVRNRLLRLQDRLAAEADNKDDDLATLALTWADIQIPIHLAWNSLVLGQDAIACLESIIHYNPNGTQALYLAGVAYMDNRDYSKGLEFLIKAKNNYYNSGQGEGRAAVLVALGDAYQKIGETKESVRWYTNALRQSPQTDNLLEMAVARERLKSIEQRQARFSGTVYLKF
ncbi:MAG: hypothetical protein PHT49_05750 [Desulfovibrionales bacterium]|nr:hypothetical protein [Desulfovibrionales bacterium]